MLMIIAYVVICAKGTTIKYDTNIFTDWDHDAFPTFLCQNSVHSKTITFSGIFQNIPKVFITQGKLDVQRYGNFVFQITGVTTTDFSIQLTCPASDSLFSYHVQWWAIDSPYMEVINCFNFTNPSAQITSSHSIPQAVYGFVTLTSFKATGDFASYLKIYNVNSTKVTISVNTTSNITQLGYQIVLGVDKSFGNYSFWYADGGGYSKNPVQLQQSKLFVLIFTGFKVNVNDNIRLQKFYIIYPTNISYAIKNSCCTYVSNNHTFLQLPYQNTQVGDAFQANHLNMRRLEIFSSSQINTFQVNFKELSQQYSDIGINILNIPITHQILNIQILILCGLNQKITVKLNYCGTCSSHRPYEQVRICFNPINTIKLLSRFFTNILSDQTFTITITSNSLTITQIVESNSNLIQLNIVSVIKSNS